MTPWSRETRSRFVEISVFPNPSGTVQISPTVPDLDMINSPGSTSNELKAAAFFSLTKILLPLINLPSPMFSIPRTGTPTSWCSCFFSIVPNGPVVIDFFSIESSHEKGRQCQLSGSGGSCSILLLSTCPMDLDGLSLFGLLYRLSPPSHSLTAVIHSGS